MDLAQQYVLGGFVIVGFVNGVNFALERNWLSFVKFLIAVISGTVFGAMGWFTIPSAEIGMALGIASSGVYKLTQVLRGA